MNSGSSGEDRFNDYFLKNGTIKEVIPCKCYGDTEGRATDTAGGNWEVRAELWIKVK